MSTPLQPRVFVPFTMPTPLQLRVERDPAKVEGGLNAAKAIVAKQTLVYVVHISTQQYGQAEKEKIQKLGIARKITELEHKALKYDGVVNCVGRTFEKAMACPFAVSNPTRDSRMLVFVSLKHDTYDAVVAELDTLRESRPLAKTYKAYGFTVYNFLHKVEHWWQDPNMRDQLALFSY